MLLLLVKLHTEGLAWWFLMVVLVLESDPVADDSVIAQEFATVLHRW